MTIKIVTGNLLEAQENLVVHQVNCQGVMGSGVAKQIRDKYPIVYDRYKLLFNSFENNANLLGEVQIVKVNHSQAIVNLFGQFSYGRGNTQYTSYIALEKGFNSLRDFAKTYGMNIAMPYGIGCGLGGADWNIVHSMIEEIFEECDVTIYKLEGN